MERIFAVLKLRSTLLRYSADINVMNNINHPSINKHVSDTQSQEQADTALESLARIIVKMYFLEREKELTHDQTNSPSENSLNKGEFSVVPSRLPKNRK